MSASSFAFAGRNATFRVLDSTTDLTSLDDIAVEVELDGEVLEDFWSPIFVAAFTRDETLLVRLSAMYVNAYTDARLRCNGRIAIGVDSDNVTAVRVLEPLLPLIASGEDVEAIAEDMSWFHRVFVAPIVAAGAQLLVPLDRYPALHPALRAATSVQPYVPFEDVSRLSTQALGLWSAATLAAEPQSLVAPASLWVDKRLPEGEVLSLSIRHLAFFVALTGFRGESTQEHAQVFAALGDFVAQHWSDCALSRIPDTHAEAIQNAIILDDGATVFKSDLAFLSFCRALRQQTAAHAGLMAPWKAFAARIEAVTRAPRGAPGDDDAGGGDAGSFKIVVDEFHAYLNTDKAPSTTPAKMSFDAAQAWFAANAARFKDSVKLEVYALFKQASSGDVTGSRPWAIEMRARAKYDAWEKLRGMSPCCAESAYIEKCTELKASTMS